MTFSPLRNDTKTKLDSGMSLGYINRKQTHRVQKGTPQCRCEINRKWMVNSISNQQTPGALTGLYSAWFQASAAMWMRTALFWVITRVVVNFLPTFRDILSVPPSRDKTDPWPLTRGRRLQYCACAILSSVACPALQYSHKLFHKQHGFRKKVTEHKMRALFLSTTLVCNISHSKKNWARCDQTCLLVFM